MQLFNTKANSDYALAPWAIVFRGTKIIEVQA